MVRQQTTRVECRLLRQIRGHTTPRYYVVEGRMIFNFHVTLPSVTSHK
jgi:hypothetical protein